MRQASPFLARNTCSNHNFESVILRIITLKSFILASQEIDHKKFDEIDYLSVVHTDRLLEKYKEFAKTNEGKKAFFDNNEQDV